MKDLHSSNSYDIQSRLFFEGFDLPNYESRITNHGDSPEANRMAG